MIPFIDTHCHLDLFPGISKNPGVENDLPIKTISVTNAPFFFQPNQKLFSSSNNIRIALGMHPELVSKYFDQIDIFEKNVSLTKYIGEIGLDGSQDFKNTFDLQKRSFERILKIVASVDYKILTVHSRNAANETIELLESKLAKKNCKVILHWFSGDLTQLQKALKAGFYFSINYKMAKSAKGSQLINSIPNDRILTESDAPFTFSSAVKDRTTCLQIAVEEIAKIKKWSSSECKGLIFENFTTLVK